jgi:hypothetical protein
MYRTLEKKLESIWKKPGTNPFEKAEKRIGTGVVSGP